MCSSQAPIRSPSFPHTSLIKVHTSSHAWTPLLHVKVISLAQPLSQRYWGKCSPRATGRLPSACDTNNRIPRHKFWQVYFALFDFQIFVRVSPFSPLHFSPSLFTVLLMKASKEETHERDTRNALNKRKIKTFSP